MRVTMREEGACGRRCMEQERRCLLASSEREDEAS